MSNGNGTSNGGTGTDTNADARWWSRSQWHMRIDEPKSKDEERLMAIAMYLVLHVFMIIGLLIRPTSVRLAVDNGDMTIPIALFGSATIAIILYIRASYSSPGYVEGPSDFEAPPSYEMVRPVTAMNGNGTIMSLPSSAISSSSSSSHQSASLPSFSSLMHNGSHDDNVGCMPIPLSSSSSIALTMASVPSISSQRVATVKRLNVAAAPPNDDKDNDSDERRDLLSVEHTIVHIGRYDNNNMVPSTSLHPNTRGNNNGNGNSNGNDGSNSNSNNGVGANVGDRIKKHGHPHLGHLVDNPAALTAMGYGIDHDHDPELEEGRFGEGNARVYHPTNVNMMMRATQQRGDDIWCVFCQSMKPMRSKHCHKCKRCIVKFDHHCPFIANCVGGMNHRLFWWYLFWQNIANVWCWQQNWSVWSSNDSTWMWTLALITTILLSFMCFTSLALFGFHSYLAITGRTTWQMIKIQRVRNPPRGHSGSFGVDLAGADDEFNYGIITNLLVFCCVRLRAEWLVSPSYTVPHQGVAPPIYDHVSSVI